MLLPAWVLSLAVGIAAALGLPRPAALTLLAVALAGAWLARRSLPIAGVALGFVLGAGHGLLAVPAPDSTGPAEDSAVPVIARVVRGPETVGAEGRSRLLVALRTVAQSPEEGMAAITVMRGRPAVAPGDLAAFHATVRAPWGLANPGLPNARWAAAARGVDYYGLVSASNDIVVHDQGWALGPRRLAHQARQKLTRALLREVKEPRASLLRALILGERTAVPAAIEDGFRAAGATHALSVSGLHLAAIAALVFWLFKTVAGAVPSLALRVPPARLAAGLCLPAVAFYTLLTGEAVATERSALMAAVVLGATVLARPFSLANSIAAAGAVLLVRNPLVLLDVSFQLSFASVIALGLFARRLAPRRDRQAARFRRVLVWVCRFLGASFAAGLLTAPLVAHHFGQITPAAPLGNLALVPLVELVVLPLGLGGAMLGWASPWLGQVPLAVAEGGAQVVITIAELFRRFAPVLSVQRPTVLETAALTAGCGLFLAGATSAGGRSRLWWLAVGSLALAAVSLGGRELARRTSDDVRVTFLDVGQGDAAVIEGPRGFVAVIDAGGDPHGSFDPGARVVGPFLESRGIRRVDLLVLSHPHPDHMNGLFHLLAQFEIETLWTSGDNGRNPAYDKLMSLARERGVATPRPHALLRNGLAVVPVGPFVGDAIGPPPGTSVNDASLAVRIHYRGRSLLFTGDLEEDGEAELVGRAALGVEVGSDVLKAPHHGSRTSSTDELLDLVRPAVAVISLGRNNPFGFPRREVLARYGARGIRVLRTDISGAVTVTLGHQGTLVTTCARGCR